MDSNLDIPDFLLKVISFLKVYAFNTSSLISQPTFSCLVFLFFIFFVMFSHSITGIILYRGRKYSVFLTI